MIENFEKITFELTEKELELIPILISGFKQHRQNNPIKAYQIVDNMKIYLKEKNFKLRFTEPRLRKCCNYIRSNSLLPLIATSNGYYISEDKKVIESQVTSLIQRANSILKTAQGLNKFIN